MNLSRRFLNLLIQIRMEIIAFDSKDLMVNVNVDRIIEGMSLSS